MDQNDIDYMAKILGKVSGNNNAKPKTNQKIINESEALPEVDITSDMKSILDKMYGTSKQTISESFRNDASSMTKRMNYEDIDIDIDNLPTKNFNTPHSPVDTLTTEQYTSNSNISPIKENYNVVVELYPMSTTRKIYSVVSNSGRLTEYKNYGTFEAAHLISEHLSGRSKNNISEIIKLDEDYTNELNNALYLKSKVQKCVELKEHEAKVKIEQKYSTSLKEMQVIQKKMRKYFTSI